MPCPASRTRASTGDVLIAPHAEPPWASRSNGAGGRSRCRLLGPEGSRPDRAAHSGVDGGPVEREARLCCNTISRPGIDRPGPTGIVTPPATCAQAMGAGASAAPLALRSATPAGARASVERESRERLADLGSHAACLRRRLRASGRARSPLGVKPPPCRRRREAPRGWIRLSLSGWIAHRAEDAKRRWGLAILFTGAVEQAFVR